VRDDSKAFLFELLDTAAPSGFEVAAGRVWRAEAEKFADEVTVDSSGSSYARLAGSGPKVMIEGHIDEIGLMVSHIDDQGFLWFNPIGGWDPQVLVGQRVRLSTANGPLAGVIGKKPIHQMDSDERDKVSAIKTLWIDIGARDGEEARGRVAIGDAAVIEQPLVQLTGDLLAGRGLDNRVGAFVALEALRKLAEGERPAADVWAVAPVQEEIGLWGGMTSAFNLNPDVAIAIDVTHATDHPEANVRGLGLCKLGGGPALARGSAIHPGVFERLTAAAEGDGIPYTVETAPARLPGCAQASRPGWCRSPTATCTRPMRWSA
jgi:endoglucanase